MNDFEETTTENKSGNSLAKDLIKDICIALIIVLAISFVIKPTIVKEKSMQDTLYENNYLIVNKLAYINKDHPKRGDIIIFKSDLINSDTGKKMLLIKRVIGVEGDIIRFEDNNVYRNGDLLAEDYIKDEDPEARCYPNGMVYTVGEDEIFVMGDNRAVSRDSRDPDVGLVSEDKVVGKAFIRLFPFDEIKLL
ncbi:MAG: signal peptidase I [Bacillota bacterium]|nr:signal peptidase I [Bacillota bacterium]